MIKGHCILKRTLELRLHDILTLMGKGSTLELALHLQDDVIIIDKQVDANWYSGHLGDKKGIFPVTYVQAVEQ